MMPIKFPRYSFNRINSIENIKIRSTIKRTMKIKVCYNSLNIPDSSSIYQPNIRLLLVHL